MVPPGEEAQLTLSSPPLSTFRFSVLMMELPGATTLGRIRPSAAGPRLLNHEISLISLLAARKLSLLPTTSRFFASFGSVIEVRQGGDAQLSPELPAEKTFR